jgi:2-C-methyl-D-erythritol 4-phosphate cytidylyltransferase
MGGQRKAFLQLAGEPLLARALRPFLADARVVRVVVSLGSEDVASPPDWLTELAPRVGIVSGGETRTASVRAALTALPEDLDVIAVHDAARPLVTMETVRKCIDLALAGLGAVAGSPAVDTVKRVDAQGIVVDTPDRATLWLAQTPQVFPADILRSAYADPSAEGTDDAALVERTCGHLPVRMVDAGVSNLKVTRPEDLILAEAILASRSRT